MPEARERPGHRFLSNRENQRLRFVREANHVKKTGTKIVEMKVAASIPPKTPVPIE